MSETEVTTDDDIKQTRGEEEKAAGTNVGVKDKRGTFVSREQNVEFQSQTTFYLPVLAVQAEKVLPRNTMTPLMSVTVQEKRLTG